jgi:hypothetical protein
VIPAGARPQPPGGTAADLDRLGHRLDAIAAALNAACRQPEGAVRDRWLTVVRRAVDAADGEYSQAAAAVEKRPQLRLVPMPPATPATPPVFPQGRASTADRFRSM